MPLTSQLMAGDERLEACLVKDSAHLTRGVTGEFVAQVQAALMYLDNLPIAEGELEKKLYGPTTAAAVLAFKKARKIINTSYQNSEDEIVGKMTIRVLDAEMARAENTPDATPSSPICCGRVH